MKGEQADIVVIGAGAAGLMTAIWAARGLTTTPTRIILIDGARTIGAKILVAGGGRCNVTHHQVDEQQYAGGPRNLIRRVLRRFDVPDTVAFFAQLGVELKREDTGKLFPTTDSARTVLNALLAEVRRTGVELRHPWRARAADRSADARFIISPEGKTHEPIRCDRLVLATGGMALPKTGSDGAGYALARALGHTVTPHTFPALVPLITGAPSRWLNELSGVSARARVEVRSGTGKRLAAFLNDLLCTHFGLSGPAVMDASRHLTHARATDPAATLHIAWLPDETFESIDLALQHLGPKRPLSWLRERLPERLARAICAAHDIDADVPGSQFPREARRALAHTLTAMPTAITADRGFTHAEATAGGVPLDEVDAGTMQSRVCPNLYLVGELLDVDGRIGGFNFQWAWASGHVAGKAIAQASSTP